MTTFLKYQGLIAPCEMNVAFALANFEKKAPAVAVTTDVIDSFDFHD